MITPRIGLEVELRTDLDRSRITEPDDLTKVGSGYVCTNAPIDGHIEYIVCLCAKLHAVSLAKTDVLREGHIKLLPCRTNHDTTGRRARDVRDVRSRRCWVWREALRVEPLGHRVRSSR